LAAAGVVGGFCALLPSGWLAELFECGGGGAAGDAGQGGEFPDGREPAVAGSMFSGYGGGAVSRGRGFWAVQRRCGWTVRAFNRPSNRTPSVQFGVQWVSSPDVQRPARG
jgi:hypothetical protein